MKIALLDYHKKRKKFVNADLIAEGLAMNSVEVDVVRVLIGKGKYTNHHEYDALVLSGAGSETRLAENIEKSRKTIEDFFQSNKPVLGICGGHQILAVMYGSKVYDTLHEEGMSSISLTHQGSADQLFKGISETFAAYQNHKKFVQPKIGEVLAVNRFGVQAIKYNSEIYGIQFHPEYTLDLDIGRIFPNFIEIVKNKNL